MINGEIKVSYVDFLDEYHEKYDTSKVCHDISGGPDSALALYLHIHYTKTRNISTQFFSYSDYPVGMSAEPYHNVILYFNGEVTPYIKSISYNGDFMETRRELVKAWKQHHNITAPHISGVTLSPSREEQEKNNFPECLYNRYEPNKKPGRMFYDMDKRDVFTLYQIHDILGLWDMTMSCIKGNNCGECWQCHERKWAEAL
jgi:hypothetical protein